MGIECCSNLRDHDDDFQTQYQQADTFKLRFPFLTFEIKSFIQQLNEISGIKSSCCDTEIISIKQVQDKFCKGEMWQESWENVQKLFQLPEFKSIVMSELKSEQPNLKVAEKEMVNYTSKLEIGILGLLWCQGTQKEKAEAMFKLIASTKYVSCSDRELMFIFVKLLQYSIDLLQKYYSDFKDVKSIQQWKSDKNDFEFDFQSKIFKVQTKIFRYENNSKQNALQDYKIFQEIDQVYLENIYLHDLFLDIIFINDSICQSDKFLQILQDRQKFGWLFQQKQIIFKVQPIISQLYITNKGE